jgi:hypothetical protein
MHVLFRTAKRHDMLGVLTATRRAEAAEALVACEQIFRIILDKEFTKARRLLELYSNLLQNMDEQSLPGVSVVHLNGHDAQQGANGEKLEPPL